MKTKSPSSEADKETQMYKVQQYNPTSRRYKTLFTYHTWGAANSRLRFVSGKTRLVHP